MSVRLREVRLEFRLPFLLWWISFGIPAPAAFQRPLSSTPLKRSDVWLIWGGSLPRLPPLSLTASLPPAPTTDPSDPPEQLCLVHSSGCGPLYESSLSEEARFLVPIRGRHALLAPPKVRIEPGVAPADNYPSQRFITTSNNRRSWICSWGCIIHPRYFDLLSISSGSDGRGISFLLLVQPDALYSLVSLVSIQLSSRPPGPT